MKHHIMVRSRQNVYILVLSSPAPLLYSPDTGCCCSQCKGLPTWIQASRHTYPPGQPHLDNPSLRRSSQVTLDCLKLTSKINHHSGYESLWNDYHLHPVNPNPQSCMVQVYKTQWYHMLMMLPWAMRCLFHTQQEVKQRSLQGSNRLGYWEQLGHRSVNGMGDVQAEVPCWRKVFY